MTARWKMILWLFFWSGRCHADKIIVVKKHYVALEPSYLEVKDRYWVDLITPVHHMFPHLHSWKEVIEKMSFQASAFPSPKFYQTLDHERHYAGLFVSPATLKQLQSVKALRCELDINIRHNWFPWHYKANVKLSIEALQVFIDKKLVHTLVFPEPQIYDATASTSLTSHSARVKVCRATSRPNAAFHDKAVVFHQAYEKYPHFQVLDAKLVQLHVGNVFPVHEFTSKTIDHRSHELLNIVIDFTQHTARRPTRETWNALVKRKYAGMMIQHSKYAEFQRKHSEKQACEVEIVFQTTPSTNIKSIDIEQLQLFESGTQLLTLLDEHPLVRVQFIKTGNLRRHGHEKYRDIQATLKHCSALEHAKNTPRLCQAGDQCAIDTQLIQDETEMIETIEFERCEFAEHYASTLVNFIKQTHGEQTEKSKPEPEHISTQQQEHVELSPLGMASDGDGGWLYATSGVEILTLGLIWGVIYRYYIRRKKQLSRT